MFCVASRAASVYDSGDDSGLHLKNPSSQIVGHYHRRYRKSEARPPSALCAGLRECKREKDRQSLRQRGKLHASTLTPNP